MAEGGSAIPTSEDVQGIFGRFESRPIGVEAGPKRMGLRITGTADRVRGDGCARSEPSLPEQDKSWKACAISRSLSWKPVRGREKIRGDDDDDEQAMESSSGRAESTTKPNV